MRSQYDEIVESIKKNAKKIVKDQKRIQFSIGGFRCVIEDIDDQQRFVPTYNRYVLTIESMESGRGLKFGLYEEIEMAVKIMAEHADDEETTIKMLLVLGNTMTKERLSREIEHRSSEIRSRISLLFNDLEKIESLKRFNDISETIPDKMPCQDVVIPVIVRVLEKDLADFESFLATYGKQKQVFVVKQ